MGTGASLHDGRLRRLDEVDLYVVITEAFCAGRPALSVLDACLDAGVKMIQCREKELDDVAYFDRVCAFRERARASNALLIVDDRVDIALAADADGVHLGQADLPVAAARRIAPDLIVGASSHSQAQARAAEAAGASYVNIGPIYPTQTKLNTHAPLGPEAIGEIRSGLTIPATAMGGIKAHNLGPILAQCVRHIAVVTAVTAADDVRAAAASLREAIQRGRDAAAAGNPGLAG